MKATRHNGRSGKHGTYDAKHNDRRFDVENSEHTYTDKKEAWAMRWKSEPIRLEICKDYQMR